MFVNLIALLYLTILQWSPSIMTEPKLSVFIKLYQGEFGTGINMDLNKTCKILVNNFNFFF